MATNNARAGSARSVIVYGVEALLVTLDAQWDTTSDMASRTTLSESEARLQTALRNSGVDIPPSALTLTSNTPLALTPSDEAMVTSSSTLDLAWCCAMYAAAVDGTSHVVTTLHERLNNTVLFGQLDQDGNVVPSTRDFLGAALVFASLNGATTAIVPEPCVANLPDIPRLQVYGVRQLRDVIAWIRGDSVVIHDN